MPASEDKFSAHYLHTVLEGVDDYFKSSFAISGKFVYIRFNGGEK